MAKMIVFEGISGSGKSYLIDALISQNRQCEFIKWFDNGLTIDLLSNIQKMMPVSHDFFSVCYALDFYGKYKYKIEPELGESDLKFRVEIIRKNGRIGEEKINELYKQTCENLQNSESMLNLGVKYKIGQREKDLGKAIKYMSQVVDQQFEILNSLLAVL